MDNGDNSIPLDYQSSLSATYWDKKKSKVLSPNMSIKWSIFYSTNNPGIARFRGTTVISVFKSKIEETVLQRQRAIRSVGVLWREGQIKEMCLQMFLEGINWNGWTDRQQEVVPKRRGARVKWSGTCVGLDPGNQQNDSHVSYLWTAWEWWGKHWVKMSNILVIYWQSNIVSVKLALNWSVSS